MNTNQLKKFAQEARIKLIEQVGAKLSFVLTADTAVLREQAGQLKQLREELNRTTKQQLIEKVAYTWFNRLMALRFMDANDYQPLGIRVITPKDGYTLPELLDEAKRGNIPEELRLNRQKVYDLLDNRLPSTNPQNEAYKELLIASCNHLHSTFPFLFEKINDYTELLMPDDLTSDFSIITLVRNGMATDDCKNVEIIGWLYQFYISEKKDEVFASNGRVKKEDIPAATQLFTPRWIVEYMVQNTVGKLWLQNNPKSRLREHMPYFIESASLTADDYLKVSSPEEIRLLDPASGSGHILVYGFDLFTKIYEEQGYNTSDIPKLIIEKNLYGYEIDERAAQLTSLALMMKAREYQRRVFKKDITPNVLCFQDLPLTSGEIKETMRLLNNRVSDELIHDLNQMHQATNFGSLIIPQSHPKEIQQVGERLKQLLPNADVFQRIDIDKLIETLNHLMIIAKKYHCVVMNPPYMGSGNMNNELSDFTRTSYPDSKSDLMACFMECGLEMLYDKGFLGMINQHSWMFLSSYEKLRMKLIQDCFFDTLLHLGTRTFPEIGGEVVQNAAFTLLCNNIKSDGTFIRLVDFENSEIKRFKTIEAIKNPNCGWFYTANQKDFMRISSCSIGYWLSENALNAFNSNPKLEELTETRKGLATSDNDRFLRLWTEVTTNSFSYPNQINKNRKWFPINKGGEFCKWYGNYDYVINWYNDGCEIRNFKNKEGKLKSRPQNLGYSFKQAVTWSKITSSDFSARFCAGGFLFDDAAAICHSPDINLLIKVLGLLNSCVSQALLKAINPTLNIQIGDIGGIPTVISETIPIKSVSTAIENAQLYWDSHENAWDFKGNSLIHNNKQKNIDFEESYEFNKQFWQYKFIQSHKIEEQLNQLFINLYGLGNEMKPYVQLEKISIFQNEMDKESLVDLNKKIVRDPKTQEVLNYHELKLPFIPQQIIAQFISYSVGCMFGRYSLDKEGLILANQGETLQEYLHKIGKSEQECSFLPDADNIIPILDNEWFEDDIVGRFHQFLKVTFGDKNFNKNLAFIEEQIGKDIRSYFIRDFYTDHIQRYKKRPIYWMFSSPKGSFNALIYMHRYTPDTVSNILNKYLKEFIGKLHTRREHLQRVQVSGSPSEKTKAIKETDTIDKMLIELQEYEREVLFPLATERISIDLDDGVLVNYNKFGNALKEVSGLNDKKTKDKVRKFDWIDNTKII